MPPDRRRPLDLDEDDVPVRAGRGSRARTRRRPAHAGARAGVVTAVDRGRFTCRVEGAPPVTAVRSGELRRTSVVVGDTVEIVGGEGPDELGRIVRRGARRTLLRRSPDDADPVERPVVANADLLVVVCSTASPEPNPRFVDRCLVAAFDGGLDAALCLTKTDLGDGAALRAAYAPLGLPVVGVRRDGDLDPLLGLLAGRTSVLIGPSGVGKSTLVNRLVPGSDRAVGAVGAGGRGRHTSSSAVMLALPGGGQVVDTPGLRSFGLGLVSPARVLAAFPDLAGPAEDCPPGCDHLGSPGCRLDGAAGVDPDRVASLRRLLAARADPPAEATH